MYVYIYICVCVCMLYIYIFNSYANIGWFFSLAPNIGLDPGVPATCHLAEGRLGGENMEIPRFPVWK